MKKTWLFFSQAVTVFVAAWFVVATLQPQWLAPAAAPVAPPAAALPVPAAPAPATAALPGQAGPPSLAAAVKRAAPAVVSINTSRTTRHPLADDPWFRFFFGQQGIQQQQSGLGSGVIMSADGYVLTNNHVIEGADQIEAVLSDGRRAAARVIGADPESDLAVLKIDLPKLPVMTPSDSDRIEVGDTVLAIGNPFGVGQTVTSGIVSALGRDQLGINTFENFIQTDAAINPGNSGGALTDVQGRLLGINTAIYSRSGGSLGIGFAIPVNVARQTLQDIIANGQVVRGWIGVESTPLSAELAENFGAARDQQGVIITGVLNGGPAARAGLQPGDIVTHINQRPITSVATLRNGITALRPGTSAAFGVLRQGRAVQLQITPGQRPRMTAR